VSRAITLAEYVVLAKREIDQWAESYRAENDADPAHFPMVMEEGEWGEQELSERFS